MVVHTTLFIPVSDSSLTLLLFQFSGFIAILHWLFFFPFFFPVFIRLERVIKIHMTTALSTRALNQQASFP